MLAEVFDYKKAFIIKTMIFRRIVIKGYIFIYYINEDSKDILILEFSANLRITYIVIIVTYRDLFINYSFYFNI